MNKKFLFVMLALVAMVLFSCKSKEDKEGSKFVVTLTVSDVTGNSAKVSASATSSDTRYAMVVVSNTAWGLIKQEYTDVAQQNKALVASYKAAEVLLEEDFVKEYCFTGAAEKNFSGLVYNTEYAAIAFAYPSEGECGSENFVTTFTTANVAPLSFNQVEMGNYSATYDVVAQDTTKFFYVNLYEKGYVEEFMAYGYTEYDFNDAEVGMLEYAYYASYGEEASPYKLATTYMYKGKARVTFTGLKKNSEYSMVAGFYDWEADKVDSVLYRLDFKTATGGGGTEYPVKMTIDLKWNSTTLTATPSDLNQKYYFDVTYGTAADRYATVDDLAAAVLEEKGGKISASECSKGVDSYNFSDYCYYFYDEQRIVGYAFGVGEDGKICSQPVKVELTNPYYSSSSDYDYDYDWAPSRKMANKKMLGGRR